MSIIELANGQRFFLVVIDCGFMEEWHHQQLVALVFTGSYEIGLQRLATID